MLKAAAVSCSQTKNHAALQSRKTLPLKLFMRSASALASVEDGRELASILRLSDSIVEVMNIGRNRKRMSVQEPVQTS